MVRVFTRSPGPVDRGSEVTRTFGRWLNCDFVVVSTCIGESLCVPFLCRYEPLTGCLYGSSFIATPCP